MNSLERVVKMLNREKIDHIPAYPLTNSVARKAMGLTYAEWTKDVKKCAECIIRTTDELELDCISTLVDLSVEAADFGQELLYFDDKACCPNHHNRVIKEEEDYAKVKYVDPRTSPRMSEHIELAKMLVEARGQVKPIVGFVFGPLGILSMLRGQSELFVDCLVEPDLLHPALKEITKTLIDFCDALIDVGVHGIMLDTLFASASIMKEEMWEEFEGTYIQEICDHIHARGCLVMLHNCGKGAYFEAQIKRMNPCLISFLHVPFGCSSYEEAAEKFGDKVTLMGMLDPGWVYAVSDEEVREASKQAIDTFGKNPAGFVLATGCEYPAPLDFTKAKIMVEVAQTYGKMAD